MGHEVAWGNAGWRVYLVDDGDLIEGWHFCKPGKRGRILLVSGYHYFIFRCFHLLPSAFLAMHSAFLRIAWSQCYQDACCHQACPPPHLHSDEGLQHTSKLGLWATLPGFDLPRLINFRDPCIILQALIVVRANRVHLCSECHSRPASVNLNDPLLMRLLAHPYKAIRSLSSETRLWRTAYCLKRGQCCAFEPIEAKVEGMKPGNRSPNSS